MTQEHAMKRILTTVLFSAIVAGSAVAADLPPAPPPRAPVVYAPPPPVYSWTGFYIGINGGWGFGKSDWTFDNFSTGNFNVNGGVLGATAGFNWQSDWFVAGLEGDADGSWMDGKSAAASPSPPMAHSAKPRTNGWQPFAAASATLPIACCSTLPVVLPSATSSCGRQLANRH